MVQQMYKDLVVSWHARCSPSVSPVFWGRGFSFSGSIHCLGVVAVSSEGGFPLTYSALPQGDAPDSLAPRDRGAQRAPPGCAV